MNEPVNVPASQLFPKLGVLWMALLLLPFAERTLLGAKTYFFLYIGLALVFVMYGLTVRSLFFFLRHTRREPIYVWIGVPGVVSVHLQRSGSLRDRIRSSAPPARGVCYAEPAFN